MPFVGIVLLAIVAGFVGAVSGMGGGVIIIPLLTAFGVDIKEAIAASALALIAISSSATPGYVRRHIPNFNVSAFLELFAVVGAFLGAVTIVAVGRHLLFFLCGAVLMASWVVLRQRPPVTHPPAVPPDAFSQWVGLDGCYYDHAESRAIEYAGSHAALGGALMFGAGLLTGALGTGASALTVLVHEGVLKLPTKVSVTTSTLIVGLVALAGAEVYLEAGLLNPSLIAPVMLGVPVGAMLGAKLLLRFQSGLARRILLSTLMILGVEMILHGFLSRS